MKRVRIFAILFLMIIGLVPQLDGHGNPAISDNGRGAVLPAKGTSLASAEGVGDELDAVLFMSRTFTNLDFSVMNTFSNTALHTYSLDLSGFHEPEWILSRAVLNIQSLSAIAEKEVLGVNHEKDDFMIAKSGPIIIDGLTQGFYNQSHDGHLLNYSIRYRADKLDEPQFWGYAFTVIRSDYANAGSNLTLPVNLTRSTPYIWMSVDELNAILSANTVYWAVVDGTNLIEYNPGEYPTIRWSSEELPDGGEFDTKLRAGTWQDPTPNTYEALMNYTYIPWNTTANSPLEYTSPVDVLLKGNSTFLISPSTWDFRSTERNLSSINFDSNQSIAVHYNITLWYTKAITAETSWNIAASGLDVAWNATVNASYPTLFGAIKNYANITAPMDWTSDGLYNSTAPSSDYGNYLQHSSYAGKSNVTLSNMTNGTWTLTSTGFNYITGFDTYDADDDTELPSKARTDVDMDVNATVENGLSIGVTTGETNCTVIHEGATVYAPATEAPVAGHSHFLWDVSTAADNGTFTIELFWINGTEAGYRTKTMTIFYPTTLTPASDSIRANTDDSFLVSVQLDDDFNSIGIDAPDANVTYSFLTTVNATLTSDGGGQWTTTVDTTGLNNDIFTLTVYAEGFAIENQSVEITITLTHQTYLQLSWLSTTFDWNGNEVFSVDYRLTRDNSLVPDASQLIVVVDSTPLTLHGDNGTYWIVLNNTFDLGLHTIFVNVSKALFDPAWNGTAAFTITETSTSLAVSWSPANVTIEYTDLLNLTVDYTYAGGDVPPASAEVNVTIDGQTWALTYTGIEWSVSISAGELGIGVYSADVVAWLHGYQAQFNTTLNINVTASSGIVVTPLWFSETTDYVTAKILQLNVTYINGTPVSDVSITATMAGTDYFGVHIGGGIYNITLGPLYPDIIPLGLQSIDVLVEKYGFDDTIIGATLTVNEALSSLLVEPDKTVEYYDGVIIVDIYYDLLNGSYIGGTCTFDIEGESLSTVWVIDHWRVTIRGDSVGVGDHHCVVSTANYGFESQMDEFDITINAIPTSVAIVQAPSMYVNCSVFVNITYTDNRTSAPLAPDDLMTSWAGQVLSWETVVPGTLRLRIQSNALHIGLYLLDLTVNKTGYVNTTTQWTVYVNPVPTSIAVAVGGYSEWENETVSIIVFFRDDFHETYIHWARLNVTFEGIEYEALLNSGTNQYIAEIFLNSEYAPGEYLLAFEAQAENCETSYQSSTLIINPKTLYTVELDVDEQVTAGGTLGVTCILAHEGTPVNGMEILVCARFNYSGVLSSPIYKTAITTADGTADVNFDVPNNATYVILWAEFEGSRTEWAVTTQSMAVSVIPAPGLLEMLFTYLRDWRVVVVLVIASVAAAVIGVYRRELVPKRKATMSALEKQLGTFKDLQSLQHFLAVFLERGTCVFYHPFGEARIQADLISGFIAAITSVYGEIKGTGVQGQLEEVNYQGLKLNSYSGRFVIGILIVEGDMTPLLRERLQFFVEMFEDQYEADLDGWTGVIDCFDPEWIVSSLHATFNYYWVLPHRVEDKVKLKGNYEKLKRVIKNRLDERSEFLIADILPLVSSSFRITEAEAFDMMLHLADLGAITPISIHTVLQRQGLGLANGENDDDAFEIPACEDSEVDETREEEKESKTADGGAPESLTEPKEEEMSIPDETEDALSDIDALLKEKGKEKEEISDEDKFIREVEDLLSKEDGKEEEEK